MFTFGKITSIFKHESFLELWIKDYYKAWDHKKLYFNVILLMK